MQSVLIEVLIAFITENYGIQEPDVQYNLTFFMQVVRNGISTDDKVVLGKPLNYYLKN
ncbi:hypothetical protein RXV94_08610 [Yeosuana sp. MJ-SS3]|uniref:Uncharacterized protein n=1 Tax=Gilvirhabdus luticola TaxID=3079858 RepID=A0ABU3U737_9FLAO|nr:hypothetical protein [Yeosuana sp. MJ-SS3]MDU8886219.1 hypothetical protein [Yeosuana sp. MJ-SS3]